MRRGWLIWMVVLAASGAALADGIEQSQGFAVGLINDIELLVSGQSASSTNFLTVLNTQFAGTPTLGTVGQGSAEILSRVGTLNTDAVWAAMAAVTLPTADSTDFASLFSRVDGIGGFGNL